MSDLQCPATLLIAGSGDAVRTLGDLRSDDCSPLTDAGRAQVRHLVEKLGTRRIAGVYSSTMLRAVQSGEVASFELGVRQVVTSGLQEFLVGELAAGTDQDPRARQGVDGWLHGGLAATHSGAEDGHAAVTRFKQALEEIADTHRGETVLVFTHAGVTSLAIPRLSVNARDDFAAQRLLPNCAAIAVEVDADGWRIVSWPTSADPVRG